MRGYSIIALDHPRYSINIGGVLRAVGNFDASLLVLGDLRCPVDFPSDTMKISKHKPVLRVKNVFDALPFNCTPVAVDLIDNATPLPDYNHPERAFYIFGAENATLDARILDNCRDKVVIPTVRCMNLAAAVTVVLYDRLSKNHFKGKEECSK